MITRDGRFRKAGTCNNLSCVEVAGVPGGVLVRDSKQDGAGPVLSFGDEAWQRFVDSIKAR